VAHVFLHSLRSALDHGTLAPRVQITAHQRESPLQCERASDPIADGTEHGQRGEDLCYLKDLCVDARDGLVHLSFLDEHPLDLVEEVLLPEYQSEGEYLCARETKNAALVEASSEFISSRGHTRLMNAERRMKMKQAHEKAFVRHEVRDQKYSTNIREAEKQDTRLDQPSHESSRPACLELVTAAFRCLP
jgi:hypothetical protein